MLSTPRWTHIALPSLDIDASVAWYRRYTPLVELDRRSDDEGQSAWMAHEGQVENPFVLVLVSFNASRGVAQPQLGPFAHLGIEVPTRADVDRLAEMGRAGGCLHWEPADMPPPVGYILRAHRPRRQRRGVQPRPGRVRQGAGALGIGRTRLIAIARRGVAGAGRAAAVDVPQLAGGSVATDMKKSSMLRTTSTKSSKSTGLVTYALA